MCEHLMLTKVMLIRVLQKIFYIMIYNGSSNGCILNPLGKHIMKCNKRKLKDDCKYCALTKC